MNFARILDASKLLARRRLSDALITFALCAASLTVRIASLYPLDIGGDPARKWWFARTWAYANHATDWEHHMTRMAINAVVFPIQRLIADHGVVYYVAPAAAATLFTVLMFFTARRIAGYPGAIFAALCSILFDQMEHAGSQLNPEVFECLYGALSFYCLVRYHAAHRATAGRATTGWLLATGVSMFLLYLTKEPNVFLYPGYALAVWMVSRRLRDVIILASVPFGLFLVETALYAIFTEFEKGRMQLVSASYAAQEKRPWKRNTTFFGLFNRFVVVKDSWKLALYPFFVLWPALFFWRRVKPEARLVVPVAFSFLAGITFYIRGINPIQAGTLFHQRYLAPVIPGMFLTLAVVFDAAVGAIFERMPKREAIAPVLTRFRVPLIALVLGVFALWYWVDRSPRKSAGPRLMREQTEIFNRAYAAGVPIVARRVRSYEYKVPFSIHHILLSDENLLQPDGTLRENAYRTLRARGAKWYYIHKDRHAEDFVRERIQSRGCVIEVSARSYTLTVESSKAQIERCLEQAERR